MMIRRPADERGHADFGWLDTHHTFSFGRYHDPAHMGFRDLRVINDDIVEPGQGFGTHPHRDMEIVTYVLDGALEHRDSLGSGSVLRHGDVQRMTAGRGITHSEFNHSADERVRLLQIWILPGEEGLDPGYEERHFPPELLRGELVPLVTPDGEGGALRIHQDVRLLATRLVAGEQVVWPLRPGRHAWVQMARGQARVGDIDLAEGDGLAISEEEAVPIVGTGDAEILLFDLR
ncbi:pirin family protein [bacterium]|nr:pirin family protein [bacterium]